MRSQRQMPGRNQSISRDHSNVFHHYSFCVSISEAYTRKVEDSATARLACIVELGPDTIGGKTAMKPIVIGIMQQERIRERVLAIARGNYKPKPGEPKIWFTSMKSLAEVLSDENRALLHVIMQTKPASISALAETTGRKPSNLSRTLKTMSNYGIVELKRERNQVRPVANATEFRIFAQ